MPAYSIEWLDEARAGVRAVDRPTAMHLFEGILHFAHTGSARPIFFEMARTGYRGHLGVPQIRLLPFSCAFVLPHRLEDDVLALGGFRSRIAIDADDRQVPHEPRIVRIAFVLP